MSEHNNTAAALYVVSPAHSAITVFNKTGQAGQFDYRLFTTNGQLLLKGNVSMDNNGAALLPLPATTAAGLYILELGNDKINFRQKIIVER